MFLVSDLHVDFPHNVPRTDALAKAMVQGGADVLVVAGDVSHKLAHVASTLRKFEAFPGPKLFVPGNHDVWVVKPEGKEPPDSWGKLEAVKRVASEAGFQNLEAGNVRVGAYTFVGGMGWYDYSFAAPSLGLKPEAYARKEWEGLRYMDAAYARWGMSDGAVAARLTDEIGSRLVEATPPVVVVTHHVPRQRYVLRRGRPAWDYFNAFMGTQRLETVLDRVGVTRLLFGHTHRPIHETGPGAFALNNPLGYPREQLEPAATPFDVD